MNSELDAFVVARPVDLFRFKTDLVRQGDERVFVDCERDGGTEIGAGEVCELNRGGSRRCGWAAGEAEAVDEPFVV